MIYAADREAAPGVATEHVDEPIIARISHGELIKLHASRAAKALDLSTAVFLQQWESGDLDDVLRESSHPDIVRWAMLMSVGRKQPV